MDSNLIADYEMDDEKPSMFLKSAWYVNHYFRNAEQTMAANRSEKNNALKKMDETSLEQYMNNVLPNKSIYYKI